MNPIITALANIRRSPYQALAAILITSVTFTVIFSLSFFLYGAHVVLTYYESRPQVIGFFELEADAADIESTRSLLESKPYVSAVTITSKEDALKIYSDTYRNSPLLLELVTADILPASVEVSATEITALSRISEELRNAPGVEDVVYQNDIINAVASWISTGRTIGIVSAATLTTLSFLIILVIISMRVSMYKNRIKVMRLLGASRWYVRWPYMYEGVLYGGVGAILGWMVSFGILLYFSPDIQGFVSEVHLLPLPWELLALQAVVGIALGKFLGGFAGLTAASRLIRQ